MGCYAIPAVAAIMHFFMRKKIPSINTKYHRWLNQLMLGGAIFGIVDHWWNGELFMLSGNIIMDLMLGLTITVVIYAVWVGLVIFDKIASKNTHISES